MILKEKVADKLWVSRDGNSVAYVNDYTGNLHYYQDCKENIMHILAVADDGWCYGSMEAYLDGDMLVVI